MSDVTKALRKSVSNTWMRAYEPDDSLRSAPKDQLEREYGSFPKYTNDLTEDQKRRSAQLWMELKRRHLEALADVQAQYITVYSNAETSGKWENGTPFPGDAARVRAVIPGLFGLPQVVEGITKRGRDGRYNVRITSRNVGGARNVCLSPAWHLIEPLPPDNHPGWSRLESAIQAA